MALWQYEQWYKEDVSPYLDKETKLKIAKRISEISLRQPIFLAGITIKHDEVPELKPFSHTKEFTGMQLYAVMTEIVKEFGMIKDFPSASDIAMKKARLRR